MAKKITFAWEHGKPDNIEYYKLWEKHESEQSFFVVADNIKALQFSLLMEEKEDGKYLYGVTAHTQFADSGMSNTVEVDFFVPYPPFMLPYSVE
jgi:hypothetical protein